MGYELFDERINGLCAYKLHLDVEVGMGFTQLSAEGLRIV